MQIAIFGMMFVFGTGISVGVMYEAYNSKSSAPEKILLVLLWLSWPLAIFVGYLIYALR